VGQTATTIKRGVNNSEKVLRLRKILIIIMSAINRKNFSAVNNSENEAELT